MSQCAMSVLLRDIAEVGDNEAAESLLAIMIEVADRFMSIIVLHVIN